MAGAALTNSGSGTALFNAGATLTNSGGGTTLVNTPARR